MQNIVKHSGWKAMILVATMIGGCENAATSSPGKIRPLTGLEMDQVTVGSAMAVNNGEANAIGSAPDTAVATSTLANSAGTRPSAEPTFVNYATSSVVASAANGIFVQAGGSSQIKVDGGNGGAAIDAAANSAATGNENNNHAEVNIQFTGLSLNHLDFAYGSVSSNACCNPSDQAEAEVDSTARGPYTNKLQAEPVSDTPGEVQRRIDAAVASSTLPLLDAGQAATVIAPALRQSIGQ
ncbi:MAG: hypothetical protein ACREE9_15110 [Stellaceae bacterium]